MSDAKQKVLDALFGGDPAFLEEVLANEPDAVNAVTEAGVSAIRMTLYNQTHDMLEILLRHATAIDLFDAAALGRTERVVAILAESPTAVAERSGDGFTALHLASFFDHAETVRALLARGASTLAVSENQMRVQPLHSAVAKRSLEIASLLLEHGADPNAAQMGGWTPLHAAVKQENVPLIRLLLAHGADPERTGHDGRNAFHMASDAKNPEVRALIFGSGGVEA